MTDEKQIAKKLRDKFAQSYDDWDSGYRDIDFIIKKAKEEYTMFIYERKKLLNSQKRNKELKRQIEKLKKNVYP